MKDIESPSGVNLRPEPPSAVRLSKRAGIIAVVIVTAVIGLVGYGIATRKQRTASDLERVDSTKLTAASDAGKVIASEVPTRVVTGATALAPPQPVPPLQAPETSRGTAGEPAGPPRLYATPTPVAPPIRELTPEEKAQVAAYRQELEAQSAPTVTGSGIGGAHRANGPDLPTRQGDIEQITALLQGMQGSGQRNSTDLRKAAAVVKAAADGTAPEGDEYAEQNMQDKKAAFLSSARPHSGERSNEPTRVKPSSRYEIKAGWDIPAVLEQSLNSDLPGEVRALVRENVYDTATGNYVLIPQGSRLLGRYDSKIGYAQNGVTVIWDRVIFPDGSSIELEGMAGQDAQGRSGLRHDVDNHYRRLIGFAALTSGFSAAFQLSQSRRGGLLAYPSAGETAGSAVGAELSRLGADVTRRNLNVQPTIKVPVGYRFNVRVNRDLVFEEPYRPARM